MSINIMSETTKHIKHFNFRYAVGFAVLSMFFAVVLGGVGNSTAYALESEPTLINVFPVPGASYDGAHPTYNNIALNYAIVSDHGWSPENHFGVYYPRSGNLPFTPKTITITPGLTNNSNCASTMKRHIFKGNTNPPTSKLTITINKDPHQTYTLTGEGTGATGICKNPRNITVTSAILDLPSNKWKVDVDMKITEPHNVPAHLDDRTFSFSLKSSADSIIGNVNSEGTQNNGLFYKTDDKNKANGYYATTKLTFGLACDANYGALHRVTIYDPDNGTSGQSGADVRFRIYDNGNAMSSSAYSVRGKARPGSDPGGPFLQPDDNPNENSSITSTVDITMTKGHRYILKIWNIYHAGKNSTAGSNYVGIGLPGDSIMGSPDYDCSRVNWTLSPTVGGLPSSLEAGSSYTANPIIANSGSSNSSSVNWQLTKIIISPGKAVPNISGGISDADPCGTYFRSADANCLTIDSGSSVFNSSGNVVSGKALSNYSSNAEDLQVGSKLCIALSVKPYSGSASNWSHSPPNCATIGIHPKVQVWGGDIWVGGNVQTSTTIKTIGSDKKTFGSWVEYGIFAGVYSATGTIKGTGSESVLNGGSTDDTVCGRSKLSFTNTPADSPNCTEVGTIGNYKISSIISDVAASFPGSSGAIPNGGTISPGGLMAGAGTYIATGTNINLSLSTLSSGQTVVIKASGTVTITDDQKYNPGGYTNISQIPQLVIIANKIIINNNVKNIDAWLIALNKDKTGEIDTCSGTEPIKVVGQCDNPLVVNGPVETNKLNLWRTGGSGQGADSGNPAETFNLRADAYLWAYARASGGGKIQTVYTTELPPRL